MSLVTGKITGYRCNSSGDGYSWPKMGADLRLQGGIPYTTKQGIYRLGTGKAVSCFWWQGKQGRGADCAQKTMNSTYNIRSLTEVEIGRLEKSLGKPVDRAYLVMWVSQAISDAVMLSQLPTARECRDGLLRLSREGERWLEHIKEYQGASVVLGSIQLDEICEKVLQCCGRFKSAAQHLTRGVKPGHPTSPPALMAFLDKMIGIAKRANVLPSTPTRSLRSQTAPRPQPAFFRFAAQALEVAREVIKSSPLPEPARKAALSSLRIQSREALSKILEQARGKIGTYRETPHGLVEW
jgi:hypothetical protein